ncbi:hypothetical protein DSO57_1039124 [Entomophthora muscae]|uniref:Uncharacterized protein n=1 Tax=Entomophthora muscae TaxID=34485 RepID=A0ACC2T9H4_9FUNG|nr:hypothetical protein DSO57_1039124 [Entomophthora muscae]
MFSIKISTFAQALFEYETIFKSTNFFFSVLAKEECQKYITWTEDGMGFVIHSIREFQNNLLHSYFKHQNIESFFRQLNVRLLYNTNTLSFMVLSAPLMEERFEARELMPAVASSTNISYAISLS